MERRSSFGGVRLIIALAVALFATCSYFASTQVNPYTGEKQRVAMTPQQEVALGLQAVPEMEQQFGGPDPDSRAQRLVDDVGRRLVERSSVSRVDYPFEFHALADPRTVNAFALPGGQVFITRALLTKLKTPGELAGVLAHEVGHVVGRHSAERMAKERFTQGLTGAAVIASTDPSNPNTYRNAAVAQMIGQMVNLRHSREDELEADKLGVRIMTEAGYDPRALIRVMEVLESAGGGGGPEFLKTHPNPRNRAGRIEAAIKEEFPNGVPKGLER